MNISVTILTKNSAHSLAQALHSLSSFDEVIVYDTGSEDQTREVAKRYSNVRLIEGAFKGFGCTHNEASGEASNDWILSLDSDEWLSPELIEEIAGLSLNPQVVYRARRKNFFQGRWIWSCGWSPDWQKRLYHRHHTHFNDAPVHEAIICKHMNKHSLQNFIYHEPYRGVEDFLRKMQHYSGLFAQTPRLKVTPLTAIGHALFAFFKSYFLKGGVLQGYEGWLISAYNAHCALYKYLKVYEKQRASPKSVRSDRASDPA